MIKKVKLVALSLCVLPLIAGCTTPANNAPSSAPASSAAPSAPASSAPANGKIAIADQLYIEVSALGSLDYFYDHKLGMKTVGEQLGVKTEYVGPTDLNMTDMIAAFDQAIVKKPQGIVVVGFDEALNPEVKKAMDAGIPVVTVDADLPNSTRIAFVGTGNVNAGIAGGKAIAAAIGNKGKVAIMTHVGQSNLEERVAGYKQAFAQFPDIELVQVVETQSDPTVAASAAASLLQKYPDLAAIACVEAAGGAGATTAVKEANMQGKVKIIAMDRDATVLDAIEQGIVTATVVQQTALMPYYATMILYNLYNGNLQISSDNKAAGVPGVPIVIDTGVIIVDKNNAQYFKR